MRLVRVEDREICVMRVNDELFAIRNGCPHQDAPLCKGAIRRSITAEGVGEMFREAARPIITCPWHGWAFDLRSGVSVTGAVGRVRCYDVVVQDGRVLIEPRTRMQRR
jgi:nitrite reductase/ring-hydroxylating ferredoxin subunit